MNHEIEIQSQDEDLVSFYVNGILYIVEIESEIVTQEYPVSFNSFNDKIIYAEDKVMYYSVKADTLICQDVNYYNKTDLCDELEEILNKWNN